MERKFGLISVLIFVISASVYVVSMFIKDDLFSGTVIIILTIIIPTIIIPIIGLALALKGKGILKTVGILGNCFILCIAGIIPAVSILFWNTP